MEVLGYAAQLLLAGLTCFSGCGKTRTAVLTAVFTLQALLLRWALPELSAVCLALFTAGLLQGKPLPCRLLLAFLRGFAAWAVLLGLRALLPGPSLGVALAAAVPLVPASLLLARLRFARLEPWAPLLLAALCGPLSALLVWRGQGFLALPLSLLLSGVGLFAHARALREWKSLTRRADEAGALHRELHSYRSLVQANQRRVERLSAQFSRQRQAPELSEELSALRETTGDLSRMASEEAADALAAQPLPPTGLRQLDEYLEETRRACGQEGILLRLTVLETWRGDLRPRELASYELAAMAAELVENAVRAVRRGGRGDGEIVVAMGRPKGRDSYSIDVWDNGEPFRPEILARLGEEGLTTGGTGYGIASTLKQLAKCGGSLLVRDLPPQENGGMTACVTLLFDGKGQLCVQSDNAKAAEGAR